MTVAVKPPMGDHAHTVHIPWTSLSSETLRALIEEFVSREGTEYGEHEVPLQHKVDVVMGQLKRKQIGVFYDEETETCTLLALDSRGEPRR